MHLAYSSPLIYNFALAIILYNLKRLVRLRSFLSLNTWLLLYNLIILSVASIASSSRARFCLWPTIVVCKLELAMYHSQCKSMVLSDTPYASEFWHLSDFWQMSDTCQKIFWHLSDIWQKSAKCQNIFWHLSDICQKSDKCQNVVWTMFGICQLSYQCHNT